MSAEDASPLLQPRERRDHWRLRRRLLFGTCLFCMAVVTYVLVSGRDTAVADTAVTMAFVTLMGNVGAYVFGAAWEDITVATRVAPMLRGRNGST